MGVALTLLTVLVGVILTVHGVPKLVPGGSRPPAFLGRVLGDAWESAFERGRAGTAGAFRTLGVPLPGVSALLAGASQTVGGLCLVVGWGVRWAALAVAANMLVAVVVKLRGGLVGPAGFEYPLLLLAASTVVWAAAG